MSNEDKIKRLKEENHQRRIEAYRCAHPMSHLHVILWEGIRWHESYIRWAEENWEDENKTKMKREELNKTQKIIKKIVRKEDGSIVIKEIC